ncbi:MAG: hypothetical protein ABSG77_15820 [Candidatus Acidiferrum sp.]|jgi:hypothetical protein
MTKKNGWKPANNSWVTDGYQPVNSENRGYQGNLEKGYQPKVQSSTSAKPPSVGTTAVIPLANSNKGSATAPKK